MGRCGIFSFDILVLLLKGGLQSGRVWREVEEGKGARYIVMEEDLALGGEHITHYSDDVS